MRNRTLLFFVPLIQAAFFLLGFLVLGPLVKDRWFQPTLKPPITQYCFDEKEGEAAVCASDWQKDI